MNEASLLHLFHVGLIGLQVTVAPVLGVLAKFVRDVRTELRTMNGRLIDMERWRRDHEKLDDERHDASVEQIRQIQSVCEGRHDWMAQRR